MATFGDKNNMQVTEKIDHNGNAKKIIKIKRQKKPKESDEAEIISPQKPKPFSKSIFAVDQNQSNLFNQMNKNQSVYKFSLANF